MRRIKLWNQWRKRCTNPWYQKLLVLFGIIKSPTFELYYRCPNCRADMFSHKIVVKGNCTACGKPLGENDGLFLCVECQKKNNEEIY